jgi:2,3-dihydroxybenzoate-AMP ligase
MLQGTVPWPDEFAARYRAAGHWDGSTLFSVL